MILENERIVLRDFKASDIEDMIHWELVETEWQNWDAPWLAAEEPPFDAEVYRAERMVWLDKAKDENRKRWRLEIETKGDNPRHIGWVSGYSIDDDFIYTSGEGHTTIGIDICDMSARGQGYAYEAWKLWIDHLEARGEGQLYTQTWSGNVRVIGLMKKLGFVEVKRKVDFRTVNGQLYDGLTFKR